jgi:hypothetical protein
MQALPKYCQRINQEKRNEISQEIDGSSNGGNSSDHNSNNGDNEHIEKDVVDTEEQKRYKKLASYQW